MTYDVTKALSEFVVDTGYKDIPDQAVLLTKRAFLDAVGVALAGSVEECSRIVRQWIGETARADGVPVLGTTLRAPPSEAAFANAVAAHALDYDDAYAGGWLHPSSLLVPVVIGLGQQKAASGRQVIEAYLLGLEVMGKIMSGLGPSHFLRGWHSTAILGTLGSAAAAGKLVGLSQDQMCMAFGMAAAMSAGTRQSLGTMTKALQVGMAARNGVAAASLAAMGFTADSAIFDTPMGFGRLFADEGDWMPERVSNFGKPWEIVQPGLKLKLYPCCGGGQRPIESLLLEILPGWPVQAEKVSQVQVKVPAANYGQAMIHRRPKTGLQGKFSMEYCVTAAILDGKVSLTTFTDEAVLRPEAQEFFPKVSEAPHENKDKSVEVTVYLTDGSIRKSRMEHASGSIKKPMSREQVEHKFRDCAMTVLPEEQIAASIVMISQLNEVDDVARLTEQLCAPARD